MDCQTVSVEKFLLVDLSTATGPYVATVPDTWVFENNTKCYYPRSNGGIASSKRDTPKESWLVYGCKVRKVFNSYEESRKKENEATKQSDINSECEVEMGRGKRKKTSNRKYNSSADAESSSDDSSVGVYGPTQNLQTMSFGLYSSDFHFNSASQPTASCQTVPAEKESFVRSNPGQLPTIPFGLSSNSLQQNVAETWSSVADPPSVGVSHLTAGPETSQSIPVLSETYITKLVREVLKVNEKISNVMDKLVTIEKKIESITINPRDEELNGRPLCENFLSEPLKEIEEVKVLEESLSADPDKYYQLVKIVREIGGGTVSDAVKRAWKRVFSLKVMSLVNWKGVATKNHQKKGLVNSIITKAVFEGLRIKGRKPDKFELEEATRKFMKGTPEKYRISLKKMEAAVGNEVLPPGGRPAVESV